MPASNTDVLVEFFSRDDSAPLIMEFLADAGGDPEEYGANDVNELSTGVGFESALKIFVQSGIELGFISEPGVTAAAAADDVEWGAVAGAVNQSLERGMTGL
jgi:hypothetical protein